MIQLSARHRAVNAIEICSKLQMLQDTTCEFLSASTSPDRFVIRICRISFRELPISG